MNTLANITFWLLWVVLSGSVHISGINTAFLLVLLCTVVRLLIQMALYFQLLKNFLVSRVVCSPTSGIQKFSFLHVLFNFFFTFFFFFLIIAIVIGMKKYGVVVFICFYLLASDNQPFFINVLSTFVSSLRNISAGSLLLFSDVFTWKKTLTHIAREGQRQK